MDQSYDNVEPPDEPLQQEHRATARPPRREPESSEELPSLPSEQTMEVFEELKREQKRKEQESSFEQDAQIVLSDCEILPDLQGPYSTRGAIVEPPKLNPDQNNNEESDAQLQGITAMSAHRMLRGIMVRNTLIFMIK